MSGFSRTGWVEWSDLFSSKRWTRQWRFSVDQYREKRMNDPIGAMLDKTPASLVLGRDRASEIQNRAEATVNAVESPFTFCERHRAEHVSDLPRQSRLRKRVPMS